ERIIDGEAGFDGSRGAVIVGIHHATVVAGENNQRVLCEIQLVESVQNLSNRPIQFLNKIAVLADRTLGEVWVGNDWLMNCIGSEIDKKRSCPVRLDPASEARRER